MYLEIVILARIMPVANPPPDIDLQTQKFQEYEVLIYTPLYNTENGLYRGLTKKLGYINLTSHANEQFFSYRYDKERLKTLYCVYKQPLPNIFQCTAFKKHSAFLLNQNHESLTSSTLFMFLQSTLDRNGKIQQSNDNINLHPIDASYDQLKALNNHSDFNPADFENSSLRKVVTKLFYSFIQEVGDDLKFKILSEVLMLICQVAKKLIKSCNFFGLITHITNLNKTFNWDINFYISKTILHRIFKTFYKGRFAGEF